MSVRKKPVVGIIMGSDSDWPTLKPAAIGREFAAQRGVAHR